MMPRGPQGQKRPADAVANVTRVAKILTGEVEEDTGGSDKDKAAQSIGRRGGAARDKLTPERRAEPAATP
jgi:hypothetical protein